MDELPITCLMTDVVGSLRYWEQDAAAMARALRRHDAIVAEAVAGHGGRLHKSRGEGDSHLATFSSAADAVMAACAIQLAHLDADWPEAWRVAVRIAIHSGLLDDEREDDVLGAVPSRCGRIRDAASGGQTLVTEDSFRLADGQLADPVRLVSLGQHRFRDLLTAVRVYQVSHPGLPSEFPPLRSMAVVPNNLPIQVTSFTGRRKELAAVVRLLSSTRLVTLRGMGGCGKTRLALQAVADVMDDYPDGVWLVEFSALSDPARVARHVAAALKVPEVPGAMQAARLAEHLQPKRTLLILDTCEHLLDAVAELTEPLLRRCPGLRVLATSREVLDLPGEVAYHVPPMDLPPADGPGEEAEVLRTDSVQLFLERARVRGGPLQANTEDLAAVAEVCRQVDGIPLAIELAAAQVPAMSLTELASTLAGHVGELPVRLRALPERHRTLSAALRWSYDLLSRPEQRLLQRLAVFAGTFSAASAEQVCGDASLPQTGIGPGLFKLSRKSMLVSQSEADAEPRYRMLDTVRGFARQQLAAGGEEAASLSRLVAWFVAFSEEAAPRLTGPEQAQWLDRLEGEVDNLRAVLAHCIATAEALPAGLRIAVAVWRLWQTRGYMTEGRDYLAQMLEQAAAHSDPALMVRARRVAGNLAYYQADMAEAQEQWQAALAAARQLDDARDVAPLLNNLGLMALNTGRADEAYRLLEECHRELRELGDRQQAHECLSNLGLAAWYRGDLEQGLAHLTECVAYQRDEGSEWSLGESLTVLGTILTAQGDVAGARRTLEEAIALRRRIEDRSGIAETACSLASVQTLAGDWRGAKEWCDEGMRIAREDGDEWSEAEAWSILGRIALETGDHPAARSAFERALSMARQQDREQVTFLSVLGLGQLALVQDDLAGAVALLKEALAARSGMGRRNGTADALSGLARVRLRQQALPEAAALAREAMSERLAVGDRRGLAASLEDHAGLAASGGEEALAGHITQVAQCLRREIGAPLAPAERLSLEPALATAFTRLDQDRAAPPGADWPATPEELAGWLLARVVPG